MYVSLWHCTFIQFSVEMLWNFTTCDLLEKNKLRFLSQIIFKGFTFTLKLLINICFELWKRFEIELYLRVFEYYQIQYCELHCTL